MEMEPWTKYSTVLTEIINKSTFPVPKHYLTLNFLVFRCWCWRGLIAVQYKALPVTFWSESNTNFLLMIKGMFIILNYYIKKLLDVTRSGWHFSRMWNFFQGITSLVVVLTQSTANVNFIYILLTALVFFSLTHSNFMFLFRRALLIYIISVSSLPRKDLTCWILLGDIRPLQKSNFWRTCCER